MGIPWDEAIRMSWSECWIIFASRAEAYDEMHSNKEKRADDVRQATPSDYDNWV